MEGGLFDLTPSQKLYMYSAQLLPSLICFLSLREYNDLLVTSLLILPFYAITSSLYVWVFSKEQELAPYLMNELRRLGFQFQKGSALGISAFLLITIYTIIFTKIGKMVVPQHLYLGDHSVRHWFLFVPIALINPILEEWYWRLFLPKVYKYKSTQTKPKIYPYFQQIIKTLKQTFFKGHILNVSYLLFHFSLFCHFLGFWRSLPLVGTFFSVGRSMSHIKEKFGIVSAILTHYGITLSGIVLYGYIKLHLIVPAETVHKIH